MHPILQQLNTLNNFNRLKAKIDDNAIIVRDFNSSINNG